MSIKTIICFLRGDRDAILTIAESPGAFWIGAVFVLSAGLARDYDREDLIHQPWRLAIPFAASLGASFVLYAFVFLVMWGRGSNRPLFLSGYRSFLSLFWMTAPLAWLYAIPYDRMFDSESATSLHLWTLAIVAAWRVLLAIRFIAVLTDIRPLWATFLVMAMADLIAMEAALTMPMHSILDMMSGARSTGSDLIVGHWAFMILGLGYLSAPIWGIGTVLALFAIKPQWQPRTSDSPPRMTKSLVLSAVVAVVIGCFVAALTQPAQLRRFHVERLLRRGQSPAAIAEMSAHSQDDFPPHWDPPPQSVDDLRPPTIYAVIGAFVDQPPAPWVRRIYIDKLKAFWGGGQRLMFYPELAELKSLIALLEKIPEGKEIAADFLESVRPWKGFASNGEEHKCLEALQRIAGEKPD